MPIDNLNKVTPLKFRRIGNMIIMICVSCVPIVNQLPVGENGRIWATSILAIVGVFGKAITELYTENESGS